MARREENYAIAKSVIPFTKIITSENSVGSLGYDGQGNFIAPISGLYIFHVNVLKCKGDRLRSKWIVLVFDLTQNIFFYSENRRPLYMHLQRNENFVASAANTDFNFETTSISAVLRLERYDKVWV